MIATLLAKFWPVIVGIAGIAGSFLFAWVSKKAADARVARAQQQRAQAQADVASTREASAEANAAAAQAGAAQIPRDQFDAEGASLGILRKE
jgi:hypothetical protein